MTRELTIPESTGSAKVRNPWLVVIFSFVTAGVYAIVWYYKINRELRDLGQASGRQDELGRRPSNSAWAITAGRLVAVPYLVSLIRTNGRIKAAQQLAGRTNLVNGWIALILYVVAALLAFFGGLPVPFQVPLLLRMLLGTPFLSPMFAYWQSELNKVWDAIAPEGSAAATPDRLAAG